MRWPLAVVCVALSCRGAPEPTTVATAPAAAPAVVAQPIPVASTACTSTWRYALVAPLYSPVENVSAAQLAAMLPRLAMSDDTRRALGAPPGPAAASPTSKRWAVIPADELTPAVQVITVDGLHPLAREARGPLVATVCGPPNIDPNAVTTVAMTGVTAMARFTAQLMDTKGVTYPARDVADWLATSDYVHASNEVSFTDSCEPKPRRSERLFCSRDRYIELLAALHVNIVELTGSHLIDFGLGKLRRTIEMYEARGWSFFGGGRDQIEATRPLVIEHHGNQLAFLGCNVPRSENATIVNGPNVAFCDLARLEWQVRDLVSRGITPIVSIQHNEVRGHAPPLSLVNDFRRLARAGAAAVLGSQAHVPHPFEVHAGAYVHFGLGNFIFDQPWGSTRDGIVNRLYIHKGKLLTVRRLYTRIEEQGRPRPLDAKERAAFLHILAEEAKALPRARGTRVPPARIHDTGPRGTKVPPARIHDTGPRGTRVPPARIHDTGPRKPRPAATTPGIPDSFLVGKQAVYIWVELAADAATVSLRAKPRGLRKKQLDPVITGHVSTKYGIDRQRVTIR